MSELDHLAASLQAVADELERAAAHARTAARHPTNLVTLCWYHHHVVGHGQGRRLDPNSPPQRRRFLPPPGRGPDT